MQAAQRKLWRGRNRILRRRTRKAQPLQHHLTYNEFVKGDTVRVKGINGTGLFQNHVYNPRNGEEWINVYYRAGGSRSVLPHRVRLAGPKPKSKNSAKPRKRTGRK